MTFSDRDFEDALADCEASANLYELHGRLAALAMTAAGIPDREARAALFLARAPIFGGEDVHAHEVWSWDARWLLQGPSIKSLRLVPR